MKTAICDQLGIQAPIFAFTHCRDVVVEVSSRRLRRIRCGRFYRRAIKKELDWIDAQIGDKPYGVDIVIPNKYEGMDDIEPDEMLKHLEAMILQEHRDFAENLLSSHGVPAMPEDAEGPEGGLGLDRRNG